MEAAQRKEKEDLQRPKKTTVKGRLQVNHLSYKLIFM